MLSIRRMSEKDLGPLTALLADERVMRYLEAPFSPERTQAFLAEAGLCEPPLIWAVEDDGGFCGYVMCLVNPCFRKKARLSFGFHHERFSGFGAGAPLAS